MTDAPSFGVHLAGFAVRMPPGTPLEYVAQAALHPLPLAPHRVAGLMQLRGQPVVVLDASTGDAAAAAAAVRAVHAVLVVGALPNAAALLVDAPPQPLPIDAVRCVAPVDRSGALAQCPFVDAIVARRRADADADGDGDGDGDGWYDVDLPRLFAALLAN